MDSFVKRFLGGYTLWLLLFFVGETFLLYGVGLDNTQWLFWLLRDGLRWLFIVVIGIRLIKHTTTSQLLVRQRWSRLLTFVTDYKWLLLILVGLGIWSIGLAWNYQMSFFEWFVGFKYDWYYLIVFAGALFVGSTISAQTGVDNRRLHLQKEGIFRSQFVYVVVFFLGVSILWQLLKVWQPAFFIEYLGYGGFGDFVPGEAPPLYYKTGSGGVMRFSGLFGGPNVLGFFLVVIAPFLFLGLKQLKEIKGGLSQISSLIPGLVWLLRGGCLLLTFSRGAYVAGLLSLLGSYRLLGSCIKKQVIKKMLVSFLLVSFFVFMTRAINFLKSGSNQERGSGNEVAREMIQDNVWGYGPGTAGHARHYRADYSDHQKHSLSLVENVYLQLSVNLGLPGLLLYCLFWLVILLKTIKRVGSMKDTGTGTSRSLLIACMIAIVVLNIEGLVLHVWRDSQFNFLFLIFIGLLIGYHTSNTAFTSVSE